MLIIEELINNPSFNEGEYWSLVRFNKDEKVVSEGDESQDLYLLKSGCVRVLGSVELEGNKKIKPGVCDIEAGDIFGEFSLFDKEPRSASIVCLENSEIIVINGSKLIQFLELHSDIGFKFTFEVMQLLVKRLRASNQKVFSLFAWGLKAHKIDSHLG